MSQQALPNGTSKPEPSSQGQPPPPPRKPTPPFDIDNYFNSFVPRNPLRLLPTWISYWFGYRTHASQRHPYFSLHSSLRDYRLPQWYYTWHLHTIFLYFSILTGAFCGVAIIENVFLALPQLAGHQVPIVIASFGAAAILEYNTIESPLAQPRNLILGHFFAATVGVAITKLFFLLPPEQFEERRWLAGALAVGVASICMSFTKTIHPPAGATALLAATNLEIQQLGWWLLPLVLLASMLMLGSALVVNNGFGRRFPVYWWTPIDLKALKESRRKERLEKKAEREEGGDVEKTAADVDDTSQTETGSSSATDLRKDMLSGDKEREDGQQFARSVSCSNADRVPRPETETAESEQKLVKEAEQGECILISKDRMVVPQWLELSEWEDEVLRILQQKIKER